jgi:general secretion pathway protein E
LSRTRPTPTGLDSDDVVQLLDSLILDAVQARASDMHIEPKEDRLRVRYRIDGVMNEQPPVKAKLALPIISRVKVLAKMDIAERRQPQDGTFKVDLGTLGRVSLRASTFPCFEGEKLVMRILRAGDILPMDQLGMAPGQVRQMRGLVAHTGGLLLVTGPTGSGKTSSLYAALSELDTKRLNIVTLEDPMEVQLPDITQGQVNRRAGFTFSSGLRAILRQDPDVILVGEMRDPETAAIAVQASLTGHLVLSTMHTNSAIETITRLIDIGLEPYIVANALLGVISQRLVRVVCPHCAEEYTLGRDVTEEVGFPIPPESRFRRAIGCERCLHTGFRGRTGIFELVEMGDRLRTMIKGKAENHDIKAHLRERGIPTLRRVGFQIALQGKTTAAEVLRVT